MMDNDPYSFDWEPEIRDGGFGVVTARASRAGSESPGSAASTRRTRRPSPAHCSTSCSRPGSLQPRQTTGGSSARGSAGGCVRHPCGPPDASGPGTADALRGRVPRRRPGAANDRDRRAQGRPGVEGRGSDPSAPGDPDVPIASPEGQGATGGIGAREGTEPRLGLSDQAPGDRRLIDVEHDQPARQSSRPGRLPVDARGKPSHT